MAARGGFEKFEHNSAGYREILQSGWIQGILESKGRAVAASINARLDASDDWEVITSTRVGRTRARTIVSGVPMSIERRQGILGSAIDGARR